MTTTGHDRPRGSLNNPHLLRRVNALGQTDNLTNWRYLAREYVFLGLVVGLTITFYQSREGWGLAWWWNLPVTVLAITLIGAGQHRLTTLAHEASHYLLFRHRLLNELASDFLCLFPLWSATYQYRLQHLAHHQFPNDPERDPDLAQMEASGHRFRFPMSPARFVWECVMRQVLWAPGLLRYVRMRARYASLGGGPGPYESSGGRVYLLMLAGVLYLALLAGSLTVLVMWGRAWHLAVVPPALLAVMLTFYALVPTGFFRRHRIKSDVSPRWTTIFRVSYLTAVFTALAWLTRLTGEPWTLYYIVLWLAPMGTSFAFFMLLRQIVQHGNASQERFGNTRIFLVHRLIRCAVFPLGMDYHLPHHVFPFVPHYRLAALHDILMETEPYRQQARVVEGYFWHRVPPQHATVLELMAASKKDA